MAVTNIPQQPTQATARYRVLDFAEIPPVACPCGQARRGFADAPEIPFTLHRTEISENARRHYHRRIAETYVVLECAPDSYLELDGERTPARPGLSVWIPPLVRHRAAGRMTVLIIAWPKFDPADEWFDDESP